MQQAIREGTAETSRYELYRDVDPGSEHGWRLSTVLRPSRTFGSCGIQFDPGGRLWITELVGNQVSSWDPVTERLRVESPIGSDILTPDDVAFDASGNAYITTMHDGRVMKLGTDGRMTVAAPDRPENNGITVGPTGRIFVDQMRPGGQLVEIFPEPDRTPQVIVPDLDWANALEQGPDGRVYLQHFFEGYVLAVDPGTGESERVAEGFDLISAVRFDRRGRLIVLESGSGAITAVDLASGERQRLATSVKGLDNCAFDAQGRLYVSHYTSGRVLRFAADEDRLDKVIIDGGLVGPYGLAYGDPDHVICADHMSSIRVGLDGSFTPLSHLADHPYLVGLAQFDGTDYLGAAEDGTLIHLDLERIESSPLPGPLTATAVGPGSEGSALVADPSAVIHTVDHQGGVRASVASGLRHIDAVASDATVLAAVDRDLGALFIDDGGDIRMVRDDWAPSAVAVSDGVVFVVDESARSVEMVTHDGVRSLVASDLPIGFPVPGKRTTVRRPSLLAWPPTGGVMIGCDGDGSIRLLERAG